MKKLSNKLQLSAIKVSTGNPLLQCLFCDNLCEKYCLYMEQFENVFPCWKNTSNKYLNTSQVFNFRCYICVIEKVVIT